jgi:hypothetical protein
MGGADLMGIAVPGGAAGPAVNGAGAITVGGVGLTLIDPITRRFITRFGGMAQPIGKQGFVS